MLSERLVNERLQARADLSREVDWCAVVNGALGALKVLVAGLAAVAIRQIARFMLHAAVGPSMQPLAPLARAKTCCSRDGFLKIEHSFGRLRGRGRRYAPPATHIHFPNLIFHLTASVLRH